MNIRELFPNTDSDGFSREIVLSAHDHGELRKSVIDESDLVFFDKYTRRSVLLEGIPFDNMDIPLNVMQRIGPHYSQAQVTFDYMPNVLEKSVSFLGLKIALFKNDLPVFTTIEYDEGGFAIEFHDNGLHGKRLHPEQIPDISLSEIIDLLYGLATPGTAKFEGPTLAWIKSKSPSAALEILVEILSSLANSKQTTDEVEFEFSVKTGFSAYAGLKRQLKEVKVLDAEGNTLLITERMYRIFSNEKFDIDSRETNPAQITRMLSYEFYPDLPKEYDVNEKNGTDLDDYGTSAELTLQANIDKPSPDDEQWMQEIQKREVLSSEVGFSDKLVSVMAKMVKSTRR
jgi:hypothetical protein